MKSSQNSAVAILLIFPLLFIWSSITVSGYLPLSRDYFNYLDVLDQPYSLTLLTEPGLIVLANAFGLLIGTSEGVLVSISVMTFSIKYFLISRMTGWQLVPFVFTFSVYVSRFFPLHELTQLKTALAVLFLMVFLSSEARWMKALSAGLAGLMHIGTLIFLIAFYALKSSGLQKVAALRPTYRVLIASCYIGIGCFISIVVQQTLISLLAEKFEIVRLYYLVEFGKIDVNILNVAAILDVLLVLSFLATSSERDLRHDVTLAFVILTGIIIFVALNPLPSIAFRTRELLSFGVLFLVSEMLRSRRTLTIVIGISFSIMNISYYFYTFLVSSNTIFDA